MQHLKENGAKLMQNVIDDFWSLFPNARQGLITHKETLKCIRK
jgi:hypothetical protein